MIWYSISLRNTFYVYAQPINAMVSNKMSQNDYFIDDHSEYAKPDCKSQSGGVIL
jgi:hypothetical protein